VLVAKWLIKSLISMVLMFCVSGYLFYVTTGQAPWALLGHPTAGSFFYSLLPDVNIGAAKQTVQQGLGNVERTVTQFVPSDAWGDEQSAGAKPSTEVYRWVDDEGVTHFSEAPPSNRESEKLELAPLVNILPVQEPVDKSFENESALKTLREDIERQEAEKARILNEL